MQNLEILIVQKLSLDRVGDLLCSAYEGGINYWAEIVDMKESTRLDFQYEDGSVYSYIDYPLNNGSITIWDTQRDDKHILDRAKIQKGLQIMANKYPKHFSDFVNENDDAETGDVFVQCCLFGDIIYG